MMFGQHFRGSRIPKLSWRLSSSKEGKRLCKVGKFRQESRFAFTLRFLRVGRPSNGKESVWSKKNVNRNRSVRDKWWLRMQKCTSLSKCCSTLYESNTLSLSLTHTQSSIHRCINSFIHSIPITLFGKTETEEPAGASEDHCPPSLPLPWLVSSKINEADRREAMTSKRVRKGSAWDGATQKNQGERWKPSKKFDLLCRGDERRRRKTSKNVLHCLFVLKSFVDKHKLCYTTKTWSCIGRHTDQIFRL